MGSIRRKAHSLPQNAHSIGQYSSGAMERYKEWVQFARKLSPRPATTHRKTVNVPVGRWNVTTYKCVRFAGKLSPRPAMTHRKTVSVPPGRWNVTHGFDSRESSQSARHMHIAKISIPAGRWNVTHGFDVQESSQTATTHIAKVSIPVGRWRECLGRFKMQALTRCEAKITSTRTAAGQFKV